MQTFRLTNGLTGTFIPGNLIPILFVHGMWEGVWAFNNWMQYMADKGHAVYALNLRGHHGSMPCDIGTVSIDDYVSDVITMITYIRSQSGRKPIVAGHSLGGLVSQIVAQRGHAEKAAFITTAPSREIFLRGPLIGTMFKSPAYFWKMMSKQPIVMKYKDALDLELNNLPNPRALYDMFVPESGQAAGEIVSLQVSVPSNMPCKTIVFSGSKDRMTVESIQRRVAKRYGSEFRSYPNGHMIMLEEGWEKPVHDLHDFAVAA